MLKRLEVAAALVITLVVIWLHGIRLFHAGALWRDEAAAVGLATMPSLKNIVASFPHEAFPPVYFFALRAYIAVTGGSDAALRTLGLLVGLAVVGVLWMNARLNGRGLPLISLALVGFNSHFLQFGDSIRGYGLGSLLILLTFGLMAKAVEKPQPGWFVAVLCSAILSVQFLLSNSVLLLAICGAAAGVFLLRKQWRPALIVFGVAAVAGLSLLWFAGALAAAREWDMLVRYPIGLPEIWAGFHHTLNAQSPFMRWIWLAIFGAGIGVAVGSSWRLTAGRADEQRSDRLRFCLLTMVFSAVGCFVFLRVLGYAPRPWYYLPVLVVLASALDGILENILKSEEMRILRLVFVGVVAISFFGPMKQEAKQRQTNMDIVAKVLEKSADPRDLILVSPWFYGVSFNRYYNGSTPWITLPNIADHKVHRYDLIKARMLSDKPIDDVFDKIRQALQSGQQVWVVGIAPVPKPGEDWRPLPPAPHPRLGWSEITYLSSWLRQLGRYLQVHAAVTEEVNVPLPGSVSFWEEVPVSRYKGWH